ncbi:MAG TPA: hypothetical protein DEA67_02110 [Selenomonas sp.]|nr:hypothetical protein [Selenomonas sp.]
MLTEGVLFRVDEFVTADGEVGQVDEGDLVIFGNGAVEGGVAQDDIIVMLFCVLLKVVFFFEMDVLRSALVFVLHEPGGAGDFCVGEAFL